jgi:hypothetical protein
MNAPENALNALPATQRPCDGCGSLFTPKRRWARFCADACRTEWHRKKALGPEGRIAELERKVADLEQRVARLDDPTRVPA